MKKFISMVMAAAMVVSLVPATAFAATDVTATAKIVDALELTETEAKEASNIDNGAYPGKVPELVIKVTNADYLTTRPGEETAEVTLTLDNAEWLQGKDVDYFEDKITIVYDKDREAGDEVTWEITEFDEEDREELTIKFTGTFDEDDKIVIDLNSTLTRTKEGTNATVSVDADDLGLNADELVYASVVGQVLELDVDDTVDVAEEEFTKLDKDGLTIEAKVGTLPEKITLKVSNGFEFTKASEVSKDKYTIDWEDDNELKVYPADGQTKIVITELEVEATTAKAGDVATIKASATDWEAASIEVVVVVAEGLSISVDEDEDVPEIWSGVASTNSELERYITDDEDHWSLEVTVEESVIGAYSDKDEIEFTLPEGVYVVGLKAEDENQTIDKTLTGEDGVFAEAYREGDHAGFVIEKRVLNETKSVADGGNGKTHEITFELELVADPGFVGDVVMEMLVDGESVGEVTIATFKTPMVVEASQNDLIIDYRNTEVPTDIVVKEAEAGLWKEGLEVAFALDKNIAFEDDAVFTVNEESDMKVDGDTKEYTTADGEKVEALVFEVDEESDEEAAVVTISGISLYMSRSLAAGAYDLEMVGNKAIAAYNAQDIFAQEHESEVTHDCDKKDCVLKITDACDYSEVVKEAFVNIVTAGRDQDDASFTKKVVVPVGESYIISGEETVTLDVPAYVSAAGYTMLPVRAVAVALGILNNNVLWDQASKTVTILYGQRIITMTVGAKVINVNGSAIPASASVEVVDGRTFLPMRDLATALGVTDITWDAATKTATLNGNK